MSANSATKLLARLSAVAAAALTAGLAATTLGVAPASAATTSNWVLTGWNIHQLNQLNPGTAASSADMVVVQDQVNTTNPAEFDHLYSTARAQAQAANPQIITDAEVSTTYGTASQMATAAKSAHADGIYINATTPTLGKTK